jgi:hypothetical protein
MWLDIRRNVRAVEWKVDDPGSDSCQITGIGISGREPLNSASTLLIALMCILIFKNG